MEALSEIVWEFHGLIVLSIISGTGEIPHYRRGKSDSALAASENSPERKKEFLIDILVVIDVAFLDLIPEQNGAK